MMSAVDEQDTASEPTGSLAYLAWPYLVELEKAVATRHFQDLRSCFSYLRIMSDVCPRRIVE
ncbi:hypothetical protein [Marinobacter sp.]|uniref:hypothetical protein n=1 Tax=Marinobacter sp. TaxID=50741 RepID=UPI003A8E38D4